MRRKYLELCALAALAISLMASLPSHGQAEELSFRGIQLGITLDEFRRVKHPDADRYVSARAACSGDPTPGIRHLRVRLTGKNEDAIGISRCMYFALHKGMPPNNFIITAALIGNSFPSTQLFEFYSSGKESKPRLFSILMFIGGGRADGLIAAMQERFGNPAESIKRIAQTRMGAKFDARTLVWRVGTGSITVDEYSPDMVRHSVTYLHIPLAAAVEKRRLEVEGKPSGRL